jgi:hypothetical protein
MRIVGYHNYGDQVITSHFPDEVFKMGVAVKVFPVDVYSRIYDDMGKTNEVKGFAENDVKKGKKLDDWYSLWNEDLYDDDENMGKWFNNFNGQPVLWEAKNDSFKYNKYTVHLSSSSLQGSKPCIVDTTVEKSVCGISNEIESNPDSLRIALEIDNPHANMMGVTVSPLLHEDYGIKKYHANNECSSFNGSYANIGMEVRFVVKQEYWNPEWGLHQPGEPLRAI